MEYFCYLFYSFIIYSFLGWVLEVIYHLLLEKRFVNRGFLHGPVCPIYGTTAVFLIITLANVSNNYLYIFAGGAVIASIVELIVGYILEALFNTKWWDYSSEKFNIKGYICLRFSIFWGILSIIFIKLINPVVSKITYWIADKNSSLIFIVLVLVLLLDVSLTINSLIVFRNIFIEVQDILLEIKANMDKLKTVKLSKENINSIYNKINHLKELKEILIDKVSLTQKRLLKAYPHLNSKKFESAIEEIRKRLRKI